MKEGTSVQQEVAMDESKQYLKAQLAEYVEQQPKSKQAIHRWMKRLEVASVGIVPAAFIVAMYVSINWATVPQTAIPITWFFFAASATPAMVLIGLHAVILRAFPPIVLPAKMPQFVTGQRAVSWGWGVMLTAVVIAAFWGLFAYSVWTRNWAMLELLVGILAAVVGVGVAIQVVYSLYRSISRSL